MKLFLLLFCFIASHVNSVSYDKCNSAINNNIPTGPKMNIKIGNSLFKATLYDNATSEAFKLLLPLTINMFELNGNEKYADLPRSLPKAAINPKTIEAGDLMLYGSSTFVLFYKTFSTSYRYTKIGRIDDVTGLIAALGTGDVNISFILQKD